MENVVFVDVGKGSNEVMGPNKHVCISDMAPLVNVRPQTLCTQLSNIDALSRCANGQLRIADISEFYTI